ncbi:hypothetical protein ACJ6UT_16935, partial [Escherichia coli]
APSRTSNALKIKTKTRRSGLSAGTLRMPATSEVATDTYNHIQEVFPNSYIARFFQNREKVLNIINHLLGKEQIIELQE